MLTPRAQVVLLRVLQERTFRPVGSASEQRVTARFVAATNAGLERLVHAGQFRADLYYRLCVFSLTPPPLRRRREDILLLAAHFIAKHGQGPALRLSARASERCSRTIGPGNCARARERDRTGGGDREKRV
jgi:Nif-specific regulatory protein